MTSKTATIDYPVSATEKTDSWLKKYSTPLAGALALVICITGVMMFYGVFKGEVQAMHEWLGMAFVVAVVLHLVRHRRPVVHLMTQQRTLVLIGLTALISASFIVLAPAKEGNPVRQVVSSVMRAPISDLAPVLGISTEEAVARLTQAGAREPAAAKSIEVLARESGVNPMKLVAAVTAPPKVKSESVEKD